MNDSSAPPCPPVDTAGCGRCGDGEDVCPDCDAALTELERELERELRRSRTPLRLATALQRFGLNVTDLDVTGRFVSVEGLGELMRVPAPGADACWELEGDAGELDMELTVAALVDYLWEVRRHAVQ